MPRRKRELSADEVELWSRVARSAAPLHGPRRRIPAEPDLDPPAKPAAAPRRLRPALPPQPAPPARPDPPDGPSRLDGRRAERLRRGKLEPEARLDLHGLRRDEAHAALVSFVLGSQAAGKRLVLVITGKGRPDLSDAVIPERTGILRHSVPHWLNAPPLTGRVIEVRPAHVRHGGAGALYLYLRRRTP